MTRQIQALVALLCVSAAFTGGYYLRYLQDTREEARTELAETRHAYGDLQNQLERAAKTSKDVADRLAKLPKTTVVTEVIHANPSGCSLSDPVADSLREQSAQGQEVRRAR